MDNIAVIIPCYNEELTIGKVIEDFKKELPQAKIYVYNNNSKDNSVSIAKEYEDVIVRNEYKQGKGNVVRRMFREVDADIYVLVDADDTYPAEHVHELIQCIKDGADVAVGDRISNGTYLKQNKRRFHNLGNTIVKKSINMLFKTDLKDIMSGYRVFNKRFVKNFPILSEKFEIETEMTLHALDKRYIIKEIPIQYRDRPSGSVSKLNTFSDGYKVLKTVLKMFKDFKPRQFFWTIALILVAMGLIVGIPVIEEFLKTSFITKVPSAILATGIMIFALIVAQCGVVLDTVVKQNRENYELNLLRYTQIENKKINRE